MWGAATVLTVLLSTNPSLALPSAGCGTELDQGRPNHRYGEVVASTASINYQDTTMLNMTLAGLKNLC